MSLDDGLRPGRRLLRRPALAKAKKALTVQRLRLCDPRAPRVVEFAADRKGTFEVGQRGLGLPRFEKDHAKRQRGVGLHARPPAPAGDSRCTVDSRLRACLSGLQIAALKMRLYGQDETVDVVRTRRRTLVVGPGPKPRELLKGGVGLALRQFDPRGVQLVRIVSPRP